MFKDSNVRLEVFRFFFRVDGVTLLSSLRTVEKKPGRTSGKRPGRMFD
jgi:hypothetical protein